MAPTSAKNIHRCKQYQQTNLHMVWQKYSTWQTSSNATGYVDDANAEAASKFFQVSHDKVLEHDSDNELENPATQGSKWINRMALPDNL